MMQNISLSQQRLNHETSENNEQIKEPFKHVTIEIK